MTDFDRECDATLEAAKKNIENGMRLAADFEAAVRTKKDWQSANGIDPDKMDRFFDSLPAEEKRKVEKEREQLKLELAHDVEQNIQTAPKKGPAGKRRSYM